MKILLVHNLIRSEDGVTFGAVEYHRMFKPHDVLDYHSEAIDNIDAIEDSKLKEFDLVLFCRAIRNPKETADRLNKLGIKFGLDLDDYWHLDRDHILFKDYQKNKTSELIVKSIKASRFVIVTNETLALKVKQYNQNVHVIENGIDSLDPVWQPSKVESRRIRFGFTQGTTHVHDIDLVAKYTGSALKDIDFLAMCQIALCGFNAEPNVGSMYVGYEKILTDHLKIPFESEYTSELKRLGKPDGTNKPYRRIWNLPVETFGTVYDELDISVAPLRKTIFNSCKSNLKMLEAGFKDCAVMVSDVSPYSPLATKENSFLLSEKNFFDWQEYIRKNPSIIKDKAAKLKEDVQGYSLQNLSIKRKQIYESL
jgi:hypothetical protein